MPIEVLPRDDYQSPDNKVTQTSRLSSFGYSGTIAHGAFGAFRPVPTSDLYFSASASLYRSRHYLSRVKNIERLYIARGAGSMGSEPVSRSTGQPAVYCKV